MSLRICHGNYYKEDTNCGSLTNAYKTIASRKKKKKSVPRAESV